MINIPPGEQPDSLNTIQSLAGIEKLLAVVARLRHPNEGCPWDLKQTHLSLRPYMLEEAYEAVEAMNMDAAHLKEELGDVLLQVTLHAQIASERTDNTRYSFEDVAQGIADKLIHRHPHVFGDTEAMTAEAVTQNWQAIKKAEKAAKLNKPLSESRHDSILSEIKANQPALSRAMAVSKKAVSVGFEWPDFESLWTCVMSEYQEFRHEADQWHQQKTSDHLASKLEDELGDILFATVNLARHFKIDPEVALTRATHKFIQRFQTMEEIVLAQSDQQDEAAVSLQEQLSRLDFQTWDHLWNQAKKQVKQTLS